MATEKSTFTTLQKVGKTEFSMREWILSKRKSYLPAFPVRKSRPRFYTPIKKDELKRIGHGLVKKIDIAKIISDLRQKRSRGIAEQIFSYAKRYKNVVEAYIYYDIHNINGFVFIEKYDSTDIKIYRKIAKTRLENPFLQYRIAVLRKKKSTKVKKLIVTLSKNSQICWKR